MNFSKYSLTITQFWKIVLVQFILFEFAHLEFVQVGDPFLHTILQKTLCRKITKKNSYFLVLGVLYKRVNEQVDSICQNCNGFFLSLSPKSKPEIIYRIVASRSTSRLVTCLGLFRLLLRGFSVLMYCDLWTKS